MSDKIEQSVIKATIVYNPLDVTDRTEADLLHQPGKSLDHYLNGLPENVEWDVALNAQPVRKEAIGLIFPQPGDSIVVTPVPEGGGSDGKSVLAIVATLALSAFAPYLGGNIAQALGYAKTGLAATIASSAVSIAGGLLINALIPPPDIGMDGGETSYGIDGPKNTSTEGTPAPILYGTHGFGGNLIDLYTENATDNDGNAIQYLYGRVAISEGPIKSIDEIWINGQDHTNFEEAEFDYRLGSEAQATNSWFSETVSMFNQARDLTTTWQGYTTTSEVDKIRLDFLCPLGLYKQGSKGGKKKRSVEIEARYRKQGDSAWITMQNMNAWNLVDDYTVTPIGPFKVAATVARTGVGEADFPVDVSVELQYRAAGSADPWVSAGAKSTGTMVGTAALEWEVVDIPEQLYEFQFVTSDPDYEATIHQAWKQSPGPMIIADKSTTPIRRTFKTPLLEEAVYEIEFRRTTDEGLVEDGIYDKVQLSDVGEIIVDPLDLPYTAWLGYKIKLTGQLNSIPQVTGVAGGMIVPIYDHNGNVVAEQFSRNPADIVLDIYLNERYGGQVEKERIDFAAYAEWRDFCTEQGLTFDGLFFESSNIDDALKHVYAAGRAQRVTSGAKLSVAIDRATDPTMMFGAGNIIKDSFEITYLPFSDRINDLEVAFFDKDSQYARSAVRVTNEEAINRGEPLKTSTIELKGITDSARALKDGIFRMNYNRLVSRVAEWQSPVEAIGCTVGDIVVVQHEMPNWGVGGRLLDGTANQVTLDRDVTMEPGKSYRLLVHQNKVKRYDVNITAQTGNLVTVDAVLTDVSQAQRLLVNGEDYAITRVLPGLTTTDLLLEQRASSDALNGATAEIWDADILDEVDVTNPADTSGVNETLSQIDLAASLPSGVPLQYANFIFGEVAQLHRKFRIKSIGRAIDGVCSISAVEYVPEVYSDTPSWTVDTSGTVTIDNVTSLSAEETLVERDGGVFESYVLVKWEAPLTGAYVSAEVQASINGEGFKTLTTTSGFSHEFKATKGDTVIVRVIATTDNGRVPVGQAPTDSLTLLGKNIPPAQPVGWTGKSGAQSITLSGPAALETDFAKFRIYAGTAGSLFANASAIAEVTASSYTRTVPDGDTLSRYWVVAVDTAGNESSESAAIDVTPLSVPTILGYATPPADPTGLSLSTTLIADGQAKVTATWNANSETDLARYEVTITENGGNELTTTVVTNRFEVTALPGTAITVKVRAVNTAGRQSGYTAVESITAAADTTPPAVPTGLSAQAGFELVWLKWDRNTESDLHHYEIYEGTTSTAPLAGTAATFSATGDQMARTGLPRNAQRWYWIRAVDTSGNKSDWSLSVNATTVSVELTAEDLQGQVDATAFAAGIIPIEIVDVLPTSGNFEGRQAYLTTNGKRYRYHSGAWTKAVDTNDLSGLITDAQIDAIDALKITGQITETQITDNAISTPKLKAGAVTATNLAAKAVTAEKMAVGDFTNLIGHGDFEDDALIPWDIPTAMATAEGTWNTGARSLYINAPSATTNALLKAPINVTEGEQILISCWAKKGSGYDGDANFKLRVGHFTDRTYLAVLKLSATDVGTDWTYREMTWTVPAGVTEIAVDIATGTATVGSLWIDTVVVRRKLAGEFIVDGTIKANHLDANSVSAAAIQAGAVGADQIAAGAIIASKMGIGDFTNLNPDRDYADPSLWPGADSFYNLSGTTWKSAKVMTIVDAADASAFVYGPKFQVSPGEELWVEMTAKVASGTGTASLNIVFAEERDMASPTQVWPSPSVGTTSASIETNAGKLTVPAGMHWAQIRVYKANNGATQVNIGGIYVRRMNGGELIVDGAIKAQHLTSGEVITASAQIRDAIITSAKIASLDAGKLTAGTALASTLTVSGTALSSIKTDAQTGAQDPVTRINGGTTQIDPGKVVISGGTSLSDWRGTSDQTTIAGGKIEARSIKAAQVEVTDSENLWPDGTFSAQDADIISSNGVGSWGFNTTNTKTGGASLSLAKDDLSESVQVLLKDDYMAPVTEGEVLYGEVEAKTGGTACTAGFYYRLVWYDSGKNYLGFSDVVSNSGLNGTWQQFSKQITVPAGASYVKWKFYNHGTQTDVWTFYVDRVVLRRAKAAELIVDGTIKGQHLDVDTITADKLQVNDLSFNNVVKGNWIEFEAVSDWDYIFRNGTRTQVNATDVPRNRNLGPVESDEQMEVSVAGQIKADPNGIYGLTTLRVEYRVKIDGVWSDYRPIRNNSGNNSDTTGYASWKSVECSMTLSGLYEAVNVRVKVVSDPGVVSLRYDGIWMKKVKK